MRGQTRYVGCCFTVFVFKYILKVYKLFFIIDTMTQILIFGDSTASDEVYLGFDCWVTRLRKFVNEKEEASVFT